MAVRAVVAPRRPPSGTGRMLLAVLVVAGLFVMHGPGAPVGGCHTAGDARGAQRLHTAPAADPGVGWWASTAQGMSGTGELCGSMPPRTARPVTADGGTWLTTADLAEQAGSALSARVAGRSPPIPGRVRLIRMGVSRT